jgi:transcriptional regulator with XRE-family HTH domain
MPYYKAKEIVEAGEAAGLSHEDMAAECRVSVGTISRWKTVGRARSRAIAPLVQKFENEIKTDFDKKGKCLDEASLEDLAARALQLGFRTTFTNTRE